VSSSTAEQPGGVPSAEQRGVDLIPGAALWKLLGYPTAAAFRQAAFKGRVPIRLIKIPGRRGHFAFARDVSQWVSEVESLQGRPNPVAQPINPCLEPGVATEGVRSSDPTTQLFGSAIRKLRVRQGRSQKSVALSLGLDQSFLAGVELGRRPPPRRDTVKRLLKELNPGTEDEKSIFLAWEIARLASVLSEGDSELQETLIQVALWVTSMPRPSRAALRLLVASHAEHKEKGHPMT
jgi:transcriptional regulator with XRE-family HTH domain